MKTLHETVAFRHHPSGYRVANLQASVDLWLAQPHEMTHVETLVTQLTTGRLRLQGGLELIRYLRTRIGDSRPSRLVLLWLAAIHEHERHQHLSLHEIAVQVNVGRIRIGDYQPLPEAQAA